MAKAVLDASAVVALVRQEHGWEAIKRIVAAGAVVAAPNLAEALIICRRRGHQRTSADLAADLAELGLQAEPLTAEDAPEIDYMVRASDDAKAKHPEVGALSLGDASCLAVARRLGLPAVASDSTWEVLGVGVQVLPFR